MLLKSDALYGTEAVMRDNFLRTKIIKPMPNKVYYEDSKDTKTLITNDINRVFKLSIPDKNSATGGLVSFYYLSYKDCYDNLISYIRTLCTPVIIK